MYYYKPIIVLVFTLLFFQSNAQQPYKIIEHRGRLGLLTSQNQTIIPAKYKYIGEIKNQLVLVGKGKFDLDKNYNIADVIPKSKFGVYSLESGEEIIPCKYNWISIQNRGSIIVYKGRFDTEDGLDKFYPAENGFGLFDSSGNRLTKCQYHYIDNLREEAIILADFNYPDIQAEFSKDCFYINCAFGYYYEDSLSHPKYRLIDKNGNDLTENQYHFIGKFSNDLALVFKGIFSNLSQYICINDEEEVIPLIYMENEEMNLDEPVGKFGYINTQGQEVIPLIYDKARTFRNGKTLVEKDGREFYIDVNGNEI